MGKSLKNYTIKYLVYILLIIIAVWAGLFYAVILDEVYDNVDDGLKNQKIQIIREVYVDSTLLITRDFGINQFKITPTDTLLKENRFTKEMIYMEYDDELEPYRVLRTGFYAPNGNPYSLEIRTSTVEEDDFKINLTISLFALYIMIIITIYVVNSLVLTKALKPLKSIIDHLQSYKFGTKHTTLSIEKNVQEFTILNEKMQNMIDRNEALFQQQKVFIENASHELQTPLAITINKLELLLEDSDLNENQLTEINETKEILHRMVGLNRSLLMLTKIENRQFDETSLVSFNRIQEDLIEDFKEILEYKKITLNYTNKGSFNFQANQNLIIILLSNLLRNAIRYNIDHGRIDISIAKNEIKIGNTSDLPPLNPNVIFERFYKYSKDKNAIGLGLSIVDSIIKTYPELNIEYNFEENMHVFLIKKS